tara:strand:+ start:19425 stop:23000 length:3576 start_codon:yes stop_codon:yes gene_type:complete
MAFKPLQGVVKLMIGTTVDVKELKQDVDNNVKGAAQQMKKLHGVAASVTGASLVGIGAISVGLFKAAQTAIAFEETFAGIKKTVEASTNQFDDLKQKIIELSTVIPVSTDELNRIGELGGQLGIAVENLPAFIQTVSTLATTTNLTVDNASLGLARLDAIAQTGGETFEQMSSVIVELGNNFAATESEIMTTVLRIAQAAAQVGATTEDALAFATALQAIGVPAQAGGTAVARVFQAINEAVITGGEELEKFSMIAEASGKVTADSFAEAFGDDAAMATVAFIEGLNNLNKEGVNIIQFLDDLDLKQRRTMLAILGLAEAEGVLADAVKTARDAYEDNNAALEEAVKRYQTTASQIEITKNVFRELGIQVGDQVKPAFKGFLDIVQETIIGLTESEKAMAIMKVTAAILTAAIITVTAAVGGFTTALTFLNAHPIFATISAAIVLFTGIAAAVANATGEFEQLIRGLNTFSQDGVVTEETIRALLGTTQEFDEVLSSFSDDKRFDIEQSIIAATVGTEGERAKALEDLEKLVDAEKQLLGDGATPYSHDYNPQNMQRLKELNELENIITDINKALAEKEKRDNQELRDNARIALGIKELAEYGTGLREMQETQIKGYIEGADAIEAYNKEQMELRDEMLGLETLFDKINDAVKDSTDTFVASFQALPDAVIMSADEMVENFRTRFLLAQIFEEQIAELKRRGLDDVAMMFAQLGPESAPNLANLLTSPEALAELEAGLETQGITAIEELKENADKIADAVGPSFVERGKESGINYMDGLVSGFKSGAPKAEGELEKKLEGIANIAEIIFDTGSPSKRMKKLGNFIMLGFVKGIQQGYPTLQREFEDKMIDLVDMIETSVNQAVSAVSGAFGDQFGLFSGANSLTKANRDLNKLLEEQNRLLKGNTAQQLKAIAEAEDKVEFLKLAYAEGTAPLYELQIAEEELANARSANANKLLDIEAQIESAQMRIGQSQFALGKDAFGLLQAGPEAVEQFKTLAKVLGIDEDLVTKITSKTDLLAQTLGVDFGNAIDTIAEEYFDFNLKVEQEKITLNLDTDSATMTLTQWLEWYTGQIAGANQQKIEPGMSLTEGGPPVHAGGGRIPMYAKGGTLGAGYGIVGEYGPELIRAIPGGGVDITPMGNFGSSNITVQNLNVNVTGVPSDPMQARKAAKAIRKELSKLDKEGLIGTGIRGR